MLGLLRDQWAPEAFVVSFKLETDNDLLIKKVRAVLTDLACENGLSAAAILREFSC